MSEAIDSLYAQTYKNFKLILCDDGSTDNTYEIAEKYAKEVVSLPMFYGITSEDVDRVIKAVNEYEPKRVLKR